jgi:hypothetical protein
LVEFGCISYMRECSQVDGPKVDLSVGSSLGGLAAAQTMFDVVARAAAPVEASDAGAGQPGAGAGSGATGVDVAVLSMALRSERSLVNILA